MPPSRVGRFVAVGLGVALLVLVAYLIAGSRAAGSDAWVGVPELAMDSARDLVFAALILVSILVAAVVVRAMFIKARIERPGSRFTAAFGIALLLLTVIVIWAVIHFFPEGALELELGEVGDGPVELPGATPQEESDGPAGVVAWFVVLSVALFGWVFATWWRGRGREARPLGLRDDHEALRGRRLLLVGLLDEAIAQLRDHPDAREATIAAWARLETALGAVGVERRDADTPSTYLVRVLEEVEASGPAVERLTAAFERAMYSPHRIDRSTQLESIDALVAVRDELRVLDRVPAHA